MLIGARRTMVNNSFKESFYITFMGDEKSISIWNLKKKNWEE